MTNVEHHGDNDVIKQARITPASEIIFHSVSRYSAAAYRPIFNQVS